jgi:hypothetical protein
MLPSSLLLLGCSFQTETGYEVSIAAGKDRLGIKLHSALTMLDVIVNLAGTERSRLWILCDQLIDVSL